MWSKLNQLTVFSQSFFGLPWIIMALLLIYQDSKILLPKDLFFWAAFFTAFFAARILGMSLNRVIDYEIDGKNPRTKNRPLQLKIISRDEVKGIILFATVLFVASCFVLSPLCFFLSPLVLFQLYAYSFTKRISTLCHFFLGSIHFFSPIFAWIAVTNAFDIRPVLLGGALWLFISGNDIVYAIQDMAFDRNYGLKSMPALLGERWALNLARVCHGLAFALLILLGLVANLFLFYYLGVFADMAIYFYSYFVKYKPGNTFQICNLFGGLILLTFTFLSILWPLSF